LPSAGRARRGAPPDAHAQVEATLDATRLESGVETATLTVRWFVGETADDRPQFSFHYSDDTGRDFGWHHEPNPHVDGWGHYQQRPDATAAYNDEAYTVSTQVPSRVVWEVMAQLQNTVAP
jgi:hypothetical protein